MSRLRWKERVEASAALRWAYARTAGTRSRVAALRGHPYEAARVLLHAWKHLGEVGLGRARATQALALIEAATRRAGALVPVADNALRRDFLCSRTARALRAKFGAFPPEHRVRLRYPRADTDPERQGDLVILKAPDDATGEKGVILVMYHEGIEAMAAVFDLGPLARRWQFVLETSNWGAQDGRFLPWIGADVEAVVLAPRADDFAFFARLGTNLVPLRVGSGEWVDPAVFTPKAASEPFLHDVVMVASWDPLKRHTTLFDALAAARAKGRRLSVALIGVPGEWTQAQVRALAAARGLGDELTVHEKIPHAEVARIVGRSRVSVLLSKQEGSNRAVYESLFVGTPAIVYAHHKGIDLGHVNPRTGLLAEDAGLADALIEAIDGRERFDPAVYAREELGYANATRKVDAALRALAAAQGRPWTRDIVAKRNAPNLRYVEPGTHARFADDYRGLEAALLPID
jgi:glycosyltransferase involved in cell wall biosynthesis